MRFLEALLKSFMHLTIQWGLCGLWTVWTTFDELFLDDPYMSYVCLFTTRIKDNKPYSVTLVFLFRVFRGTRNKSHESMSLNPGIKNISHTQSISPLCFAKLKTQEIHIVL